MKQVHWQLPFASLDGERYRIDIYKEGTPVGGIRQLTGGATPFKIDENDNEEYFDPVRGWTGIINIVDETGSVMTSIVPEDNLSRPVVFVRVRDGKVMFKGYLRCTEYSQEYISRAHEFSLNVNSMLEAYDSAYIDNSISGFFKVYEVLNRLFLFSNNFGNVVDQYYIPSYCKNFLEKYINTTILFELNEQSMKNDTYYFVNSYSVKESLRRICTYMGWVCRERGGSIYFECDKATSGFLKYNRVAIAGTTTVKYNYALEFGKTYYFQNIQMSDLSYKGVGHNYSRREGAKSVEVVAKVDKYDVKLSIPECPYGDLHRKFASLPSFEQGPKGDISYIYGAQIYASSNKTAYNNIEFGYPTCYINPSLGQGNISRYGSSDIEGVFDRMLINSQSTTGHVPTFYTAIRNTSAATFFAGAFYGKLTSWLGKYTYSGGDIIKVEYTPDTTVIEGDASDPTNIICTEPDPDDGIHCVFVPGAYIHSYTHTPSNNFDPTRSLPILKMRSIITHHLSRGYINLQSAFKVLHTAAALFEEESNIVRCTSKIDGASWDVGATLRIGNLYWDGRAWTDTVSRFRLEFFEDNVKGNWKKEMDIEDTPGLLIPVLDNMVGEVELMLWPDASNLSIAESALVVEMFFRELNLNYIMMKDSMVSNRSSNTYFRLLMIGNERACFTDKKSITTELCSDLNNRASPSTVMNSELERMTLLEYVEADGSKKKLRPETHLLDRLEEYYKVPRAIIGLEIAPIESDLPLVQITGYDGKTYLPLSESRDWKAGVSTIKCFEVPEP